MSSRLRNAASGWMRFSLRLPGFAALVTGAMLDYAAFVVLAGRRWNWDARARWLSRWSSRILRLLEVAVATEGRPPANGLLTCNHLSYLDILVLASVKPCFFVAKADVARWPLFGFLAGLAGTLFVRRDRRLEVGKFNAQLARRLACGHLVVLFPEGTSSDGRNILPFRSALLAPTEHRHEAVCPAWIGYRMEAGRVEDDVCYWGDMDFLPHFLRLLAKPRIQAAVVFGKPISDGADRKALAVRLREQVAALGLQGRILLRRGPSEAAPASAIPTEPGAAAVLQTRNNPSIGL